ncbi:META domain-containing protein [bacterium]|nr:META domain-containing protein [bacterium]
MNLWIQCVRFVTLCLGGCVWYTGEVQEESLGSISIGPLAGTRMACPEPEMSLEERFLKRLSAVERYTFQGGRLVMVCSDGDTQRLLAFTGRSQETGASSPPVRKGSE